MRAACMCVRVFAVLAIFIVANAFRSAPALAQVWLPPPGEGTLSFGYQLVNSDQHLLSSELLSADPTVEGSRGNWGDITGQNFLLGVDYGIYDRFAVSAEVGYTTSKYEGIFGESDIDDGSFHGGFQDVRFGLRYEALRGPVALTPFANFGFPTRDYETVGHASIGRALNEFQIGLAAGRTLDEILPGLYTQARYARVFVESIGGLDLNRHDAGLELGFFATPEISIRGFGSYRNTDGGVDWIDDLILNPTGGQHFHSHDRGAALQDWRLGGGLSWAVSDLLDLSLAFVGTVSGENTHNATGFVFNTNWDIGTILRRSPAM